MTDTETATPGQWDAREQVHVAARKASEAGSANVLACAFPEWRKGREGHVVACSIYCDEQTAALVRAHDVGAAGAADETERLRVQLAGCGVAALGSTLDVAAREAYGWSRSYQDVLDLRRTYDTARAEITRLSGQVALLNRELRARAAAEQISLAQRERDLEAEKAETVRLRGALEEAQRMLGAHGYEAGVFATTPVPPGAHGSWDRWTPTADAINALPPPLFRFVRDLETNADPGGMVRENLCLRDRVAELEAFIGAGIPTVKGFASDHGPRSPREAADDDFNDED